MEEKKTAVYLLVWKSELTAEDGDSYEGPLERQKQECLTFIREKGIEESRLTFYRSRSDLFRDIERDEIGRLVLLERNRLAANPGDMEGALHELNMRSVEILTVRGES